MGLQVILSCKRTPSSVPDTAVFVDLHDRIRHVKRCFGMGSDSSLQTGGGTTDYNDGTVFDRGMHPTAKQKDNAEPRQAVPPQGGRGV